VIGNSRRVTDTWGPPRLVALDIDGTILRVPEPVRPRVLAAINTAIERGAHVVLATGRSVHSTQPVLEQLGLVAGEVICSNGAVRMDLATGEYRTVHTFDATPIVDDLVELLPGAMFAVERLGTGNLVYGMPPNMIEPEWAGRVDLVSLVAEPTTRLTLFWNGHTAEELGVRLGGAVMRGVTCTFDRADPWMVAVAEGITKAAALEQLRAELGIPIEATLAVGDGDNDIAMLSWAGRGVAMGQAPDEVKAAAHEVTGTFDDDGAASILERWFGDAM
jgi:hydroxymethylpyrimidine pyrophosphatase-like HAD family hydrolase